MYWVKITLALVLLSGTRLSIGQVFSQVDSSYIEVEATVVANMPRQRDMGSMGFCTGFASALLVQKFICEHSPKDCSSEISPLSMTGWARPAKSAGKIGVDNIDFSDSSNFESIHIARKGDRLELASLSGFAALLNSQNEFSFRTERCFSYERFLSKHQASIEFEGDFLKKLNDIFSLTKTKQIEKASVCYECIAQQLQDAVGVNISLSRLRKVLSAESFDEFLFHTVFADCPMPTNFNPKPAVNYFPRENVLISGGEKVERLKATIKMAIDRKSPVLLEKICLKSNPAGECTYEHAVVVSGYAKACRDSDCKFLLKVENSWGQLWQEGFSLLQARWDVVPARIQRGASVRGG